MLLLLFRLPYTYFYFKQAQNVLQLNLHKIPRRRRRRRNIQQQFTRRTRQERREDDDAACWCRLLAGL